MCRSPIWREPMRTSSNSMMLGAALAKRRRRLKQQKKWFEAELHRIAGEIALKSPQQDAEKAETYFEHSLAIARQQQAKSWELRAAISLARLWRDQGKVQQARELLAPLLEELAC
jgi:predicted ATPase